MPDDRTITMPHGDVLSAVTRRLHIVVPYRDRETHLRAFLPHMRSYFSWDESGRDIPYRVTIVEQEEGLPFNRGAIKNIGFLLAQDSDYTCFHDIDYLPVSADYSWAESPTGIVWFGAEERPLASGPGTAVARVDLDRFFGGAILVPNVLFRQVNGYSNDYWGWGYEDNDLIRRFKAANIRCDRRKGAFLALDHESDGYDQTGAMKPAGKANEALLTRKWASNAPRAEDGLSTIAFDILARETIPDPKPLRDAAYQKVLVRLRKG